MKPATALISGTVGLALLVGASVLWSRVREGKARQIASQGSGPADNAALGAGTGLAALQDEINRLTAVHTQLAASLAAANKENARLQTKHEQAAHAARLFTELAEQTSAQTQPPTNAYPTARHVLAGIGKQARLMAELQAKWGDAEEDKLPPEEQKSMNQATLTVATEMVRLQQASDQVKGENDDFLQPANPEAMADYSTCYLFGALGLDAAQFSSVNAMLQKYCEQAAQEKLLQPGPAETPEVRTERLKALSGLNENARADLEALLSAQQTAVLKSSTFKELTLVTDRFYPPGMGVGLAGSGALPKVGP
jgi:hypothetical protein